MLDVSSSSSEEILKPLLLNNSFQLTPPGSPTVTAPAPQRPPKPPHRSPPIGSMMISAMSEFYGVLKNATQICCAIGIVSIVQKSILGLFYWPLKIGAMVKICFLPVHGQSDAFVGAVMDLIAYFFLSAVSHQLLKDFLGMPLKERQKYEVLYKFILNYLHAIETDFVVRSGYLLYVGVFRYKDDAIRKSV